MKPSKLWSRDYICLLLCVFFATIPHNIFTVLFPVYVLDIGGDNAFTGLTLTALMLSGIVTRLIVGPLIDRIGRRKILLTGAVIFMLNNLLYCFVDSLPGLLMLRIMNGISQGIFFPVPPTLVGDLSPEDRLTDGTGFFGVICGLGAALASPIGFFFYNRSPLCLFIYCTVSSLVSVGFAGGVREYYRRPEPVVRETKPRAFALSSLFELSILAPAVLYFIISLSSSSVSNYLAACGLSRGVMDISLFFVINNAVMAVTRLGAAQLEKRFGKLVLLLNGCVFIGAASALASFARSMPVFVLGAFLFGMGLALTGQFLQVIITQWVPEHRRGVANSTHMLAGDIGIGVGGGVWGFVSNSFGYAPTYLLSALCAAGACAVHLLWLCPRERKLAKERAVSA